MGRSATRLVQDRVRHVGDHLATDRSSRGEGLRSLLRSARRDHRRYSGDDVHGRRTDPGVSSPTRTRDLSPSFGGPSRVPSMAVDPGRPSAASSRVRTAEADGWLRDLVELRRPCCVGGWPANGRGCPMRRRRVLHGRASCRRRSLGSGFRRRSSCWRLRCICGSGSRTATSKSSSLNAGSRWITSPCAGG